MKTAFCIFPSVKTICCVAVALMAMWPSAMAVPAFPGKGVITQPDGSVVTVRLIGDEHSHITVTDDGYTILPDAQGRYCYARKDATGMLVSSGIECHEPAERGASELALVASLPKRLHIDASAKSLNTKRMNAKAAPLVATRFPTKGDARSLVLLVDFSDKDFVTENTHQVFTDMLNKPGYDAREHIGCAADYFRSQSMGAFNPSFDVYGPVKMPKSVNYYGENDENGNDRYAYEMVVEACRLLDGEIDFSRYDLDGDGCVDNVYVFYAGYGENFAGAKSSWIWPHAYYVSYYGVPASDRTFDGVIVDSYGCCAELYGTTGTDTSAMGTFCHEFGHILGLPDTYDVNYDDDGAANHPGVWDVMAGGSYLPYTRNSGAVPAGYNGMERYLLGWAEPVENKLWGQDKPELDKLQLDEVRHTYNLSDIPNFDQIKPAAAAMCSANGDYRDMKFNTPAEGRYVAIKVAGTHDGKAPTISEVYFKDPDGRRIDRSVWTVKYASSEALKGNHTGDKAFDLQESTYWQAAPDADLPALMVIDLGKVQRVNAMEYLPYKSQVTEGCIAGFKVYVY